MNYFISCLIGMPSMIVLTNAIGCWPAISVCGLIVSCSIWSIKP